MSHPVVQAVTQNADFDASQPVMDSIFSQYERVVIQSLITSFGLDFLIKDQYGGDVDTIDGVRRAGKDGSMEYKDRANQESYENRGVYNQADYHSDKRYTEKVHIARKHFQETGSMLEDAYTGKPIGAFGHSKGADTTKNANLDHVISSKPIHEDRGRVLSGLSGVDLANSEENLQFTNEKLNKSMQDKEIPDYIAQHPELAEETKTRMMSSYRASKKDYEHKLFVAYYTSPSFAENTILAAGNVGMRMGLRQALGLVFAEIWFAVKEEITSTYDSFKLKELFNAIKRGIKDGIRRAKQKYKEILNKLKEGFVAGALSSITITLCNIFTTTAKNVVKIIRQSWASLVEAIKILIFNPDQLPFGDQMLAATKVLAVGASTVIGYIVKELVEKSPIEAIPVVGEIASTFCGTLVTGIMSCTLLYFLDRSDYAKYFITFLNAIPTMDTVLDSYKKQATWLEGYAAQVAEIDIEKFKQEVDGYHSIAIRLCNVRSESELSDKLRDIYEQYKIETPWSEDLQLFMTDKTKSLNFK